MPHKTSPPPPALAEHQITTQPDESKIADLKTQLAAVSMSSEFQSAMTISTALGGRDFNDLPAALKHLHETTTQIKAGNLAEAESIAATQAVTLDHLFHHLLRQGMANLNSSQGEGFLRLALRAQSQSARTLETISALKSPTIFAKQLNVAQQQIVANSNTALPPSTGDYMPVTSEQTALPAPEREIVRLAKKNHQTFEVHAQE